MKRWNILTRAVLPVLALLVLSPSAYAAAGYSFQTTVFMTRKTPAAEIFWGRVGGHCGFGDGTVIGGQIFSSDPIQPV